MSSRSNSLPPLIPSSPPPINKGKSRANPIGDHPTSDAIYSQQYYEFNSTNPAPSSPLRATEGYITNGPSFEDIRDDDSASDESLDGSQSNESGLDNESKEDADLEVYTKFMKNRVEADTAELNDELQEDNQYFEELDDQEETDEDIDANEEDYEDVDDQSYSLGADSTDNSTERFSTSQLKLLAKFFQGTQNGETVTIPRSRTNRWSLTRMLTAIMENQHKPLFKHLAGQFRKFAYDSHLRSRHMRAKHWNTLLKNGAREKMQYRYQQEVRQLCKQPAFGSVFHDAEDLDKTRQPLENIVQVIQQNAPNLTASIRLFSHSPKTPLNGRLIAISAILCRLAHPYKCNYIPSLVAMNLWRAGCTVDAINLMSNLGISASYNFIRVRFHELSAVYSQWLLARAKPGNKGEMMVPVYDNFEYAENVGRPRQGDTIKFVSATTALFFPIGRRIPEGGLKQEMYQPSKPLDYLAIRRELVRNGSQYKACRTHHRIHAFERIFGHKKEGSHGREIDIPDIPFAQFSICPLDQVESKSICHPLAVIQENESFTAGNINILENIFQKQCGFERDDPRFADTLWLVVGDHKTVARMLDVKRYGKDATESYDQYKWLFPCLGLFHVRMNFMAMIWDLFWDGDGAQDTSSLKYAFNHWGLHKGANGKDFYIQEDLVKHTYDATLLAIMFAWLESRGCRLDFKSMQYQQLVDAFKEQMKGLDSWQTLLDWLENTLKDRRTGEPSNPRRAKQYDVWNHRVIFCRLAEIYGTLKHAIRTSDIGLLRKSLYEVTIVFQSKFIRKQNYQREMLRQLHLLSDASDPILQEAILSNCLVNLQGGENTGYETDLALEMQNLQLRLSLKARGATAWDTSDHLSEISLLMLELNKMAKALERAVGRKKRGGRHGIKDVNLDIFSLAQAIQASGSAVPDKPEGASTYHARILPDIWQDGMNALQENVRIFNEKRNEPGESGMSAENEDGIGVDVEETAADIIDGGIHSEVTEMFNESAVPMHGDRVS